MRGWKNMKSVKALFLLFSVLSLYYVLFLSSSISNSELNKEVPTEGKTQKSKLSNGEEPPSLTKELQSVGNIFVRADELEKEEQQVFELNKNVFDNNEVKGLCTRRPYPYEILFSNSYWQVGIILLHVANIKFILDLRAILKNSKRNVLIRIY